MLLPFFIARAGRRCLACPASMRWRHAVWGLLLMACSPSRPAAPPTKDGELEGAYEAYAAYCQLCPGASKCCLKAADFAATEWSAAAAPYLRAMREHYECMRGDTLIESGPFDEARLMPGDTTRRFPRISEKCELYACETSARVMAKNLDRALAAPRAHAADAQIACEQR
jgi:hypothetical protein